MKNLNFKNWSAELDNVSHLETEEDCHKFYDLLDLLKGNEDKKYLEKLIDTIILEDDFGLYEGLYNTIWSFLPEVVGKTLAEKLPDLQKRMGKYDQVARFYIPLPNDDKALQSFINQSSKWTNSERKTAISAITQWSAEEEDWEIILAKLGNPVQPQKESPIPEEWCEEWKTRTEKWKNSLENPNQKPYYLFWQNGKKQWISDLDFFLEFLTLNHGKHWREIERLTNPLWFFAKTTTYQPFIEKLKQISTEKQSKILENIKRVNKGKYEELKTKI